MFLTVVSNTDRSLSNNQNFYFYFFYILILLLLTVCRCCLCELEAYDTKTNSLYAQTHLTTKALSDSELLNKLIKMYTKKCYNDCFNIISRKANIIILSRLPSAANTHLYNLNKSLND